MLGSAFNCTAEPRDRALYVKEVFAEKRVEWVLPVSPVQRILRHGLIPWHIRSIRRKIRRRWVFVPRRKTAFLSRETKDSVKELLGRESGEKKERGTGGKRWDNAATLEEEDAENARGSTLEWESEVGVRVGVRNRLGEAIGKPVANLHGRWTSANSGGEKAKKG